jgi:hypothetical protein
MKNHFKIRSVKSGLGGLLLFVTGLAAAQPKHQVHDYGTIDPATWVMPSDGGVACSLGAYQHAKALLIKKNSSNYRFACVAYPKGLHFRDGVIELDLAAGSLRDFLGLAFRIRDGHHYECEYFRPAYSGSISAVQYMPEKKPDFNWWDYEAARYQASAVLPKTSWFHVRAVVRGRQLKVYIDHRPQPVMVYRSLDPDLKSGSVGFWFGNSWGCAYKNLVVTCF